MKKKEPKSPGNTTVIPHRGIGESNLELQIISDWP